MITREQVADLREGDVVRVTSSKYPDVVTEGPLAEDARRLLLGAAIVRCDDGSASWQCRDWDLTVVSRAPRPLYVNHDRDHCVQGDVVRDADDDSPPTVLVCANPDEGYDWWYCPGEGFLHRDAAPTRLRLLVDGETGQVVP